MEVIFVEYVKHKFGSIAKFDMLFLFVGFIFTMLFDLVM